MSKLTPRPVLRSVTLLLLLGAAAGSVQAADSSTPANCPMHAEHMAQAASQAAAITPTVTPPSGASAASLVQPGQDAFAAVQEVADLLDADSGTDWTQVHLLALREHLVDMEEVMLHAKVVETPLPDGFEATITGQGRTLEAIQRMVAQHVRHMGAPEGVAATTANLPDGIRLRLTTADSQRATRLRGRGFFGYLTEGNHHRMHHLALARGVSMEAMGH